jgi:hypothetical protein
MRCRHVDCDWRGLLSDLQSHLLQCPCVTLYCCNAWRSRVDHIQHCQLVDTPHEKESSLAHQVDSLTIARHFVSDETFNEERIYQQEKQVNDVNDVSSLQSKLKVWIHARINQIQEAIKHELPLFGNGKIVHQLQILWQHYHNPHAALVLGLIYNQPATTCITQHALPYFVAAYTAGVHRAGFYLGFHCWFNNCLAVGSEFIEQAIRFNDAHAQYVWFHKQWQESKRTLPNSTPKEVSAGQIARLASLRKMTNQHHHLHACIDLCRFLTQKGVFFSTERDKIAHKIRYLKKHMGLHEERVPFLPFSLQQYNFYIH